MCSSRNSYGFSSLMLLMGTITRELLDWSTNSRELLLRRISRPLLGRMMIVPSLLLDSSMTMLALERGLRDEEDLPMIEEEDRGSFPIVIFTVNCIFAPFLGSLIIIDMV